MLAGAAREWLWSGVERNAEVLATIGVGATQHNASTTRVAMAAIRATLAASNLSDEDKESFFSRLFSGTDANDFYPNGKVFDIETTGHPFHAVRDSHGLPQALVELWPQQSIRDPWSATVDYGCDPETGLTPAVQVRVSRVFTAATAVDRDSAVTVARPGGAVDCVSWRLELLDAAGDVVQAATVPLVPGLAGPPWRTTDNIPLEYVRVSFKVDGTSLHAEVQLSSAPDPFLFMQHPRVGSATPSASYDLYELLDPATAESYEGAPGVRHFFEPVSIADDAGGRGLTVTAETIARFAGLNGGNPTLSALPEEYATECDPPPEDPEFEQPHVQKTICDRRVADGHVPYGIVGQDFTTLRLTFPEAIAGIIGPQELLRGEYELERLNEDDGDLANACFWLSAEPGTTASIPDWPRENWTATLERLELAAVVNVLHGWPCSSEEGRTNWRASVSVAARLYITGYPDIGQRSIYWQSSWQLRNTAYNAINPYVTGNRADDFLAGLDAYTDLQEGGYVGFPSSGYFGDWERPITRQARMGFDYIKLRLL